MKESVVFSIVMMFGLYLDPHVALSLAHATAGSGQAPEAQPRRADFHTERPSAEARHIADWAVHSGDHKGLPFIVIDKARATLFAFDKRGRLIRATPVLLGMSIGDTFAPGAVDMDTQPWQRITPAGRYEAREHQKPSGESILWVDYASGIALHRVPTHRTKQRRQERLASPTPGDNRITYGCINVPVEFYDEVVSRHFKSKGGIVYVLPEVHSAKSLFGSYDVDDRIRQAQKSSDSRATVIHAGEAVPPDVAKAAIGIGEVQRFRIVGGSYFFKPNHVAVKAGVPVEFTLVKEQGVAPHNFVIQAPQAGIVLDEPLTSESRRVTFTPSAPGKYAFYCSNKLLFLAGHREKGMEGILEVVE